MAAGIAVWRDGALDLRHEATVDTVFEIGSVTKTFTGTLLAELALDGTVSMDDEVGRYLPCPAPSITLLDLATHTAGLPRLPANLRPAHVADPYAEYGPDDLYAAVAQVSLGTGWMYSNFGFTLLGHVLGLAAGSDFEKLVEERVLAPLGMTSTSFVVRPSLGPEWHKQPTMTGAGGLRSTIADLARWVEAGRDAATPAIALATSSHRDRMGLGWIVDWTVGDRPWTIVAHNGATGSHSSFAGWHPASGHAVAVLATPGSSNRTDRLAMDLLKELVDG